MEVELQWNGGGREVAVAGEFSQWQPWKMDGLKDGVHFIKLSLPPGRYQYKYVVDGNWLHDSEGACESDGQGNVNNVLSVKSEEVNIDSEDGDGKSNQLVVSSQDQDENDLKMNENDERFVKMIMSQCLVPRSEAVKALLDNNRNIIWALKQIYGT